LARLSELKDEPFFLAVGYVRPHLPFNCPKKYWDLYDPENINLNFHRPDSAIPVVTAVTNRYNAFSNTAFDIMQEESPDGDPNFYLRQYIHGYYACVSFVDEQIGIILNALKDSGHEDNTIVVLTSDHGFHLGSKGLV
jgi:iduronate 2-sulfatase